MICKFCGNEVSETAKFCKSCGASVEREDAFSQEAVEPVLTEGATAEESARASFVETVFESGNPQNFAENDAKPPRKKPHFLISFLCFVLMFVIFFQELVLGLTLVLKFTISESAVAKAVEAIDITSLEINDGGESKTLAELILEDVTDKDISEKDVERIVEDFEGEEYFAQVITDVTDYALNGGDAPELDGDELAEVIEDNKELIEEVTGEKLSDKELKNIRKTANEFADEFNKNIEDTEYMEQINGITAKFGVNIAVVTVCVGIIFWILVLVLAYKLNGSGVYRVFRAFSIPTFIVGVQYLILGISAPAVAEIIIAGDQSDVVVKLVEIFARFPLYAGIVLMVVFALSVTASIVLKVFYNKNTRA